MALIDPKQIHEVLVAERIASAPPRHTDPKRDLMQQLENANLSTPEILENLSSIMRSGDSDSVRTKAAEIGLKLNGVLDADKARADFTVTINILDSDFTVNPILIPR